jgi:hypothetical protein
VREDFSALIIKVLDSPYISKGTKDDVVRHYLLPKPDSTVALVIKAPIEKDEGRVGAVRRPDKQAQDLMDKPICYSAAAVANPSRIGDCRLSDKDEGVFSLRGSSLFLEFSYIGTSERSGRNERQTTHDQE